MKLKNAAKLFDTCPVYDGYDGQPLFKVQASTFLESSVDGSTAARRVISMAPNISPPAHSCLLLLGEIWILGGVNPDEWKGEAIRKAYWTKKATDLFQLLTPAQAILGQPGAQTYGQKKFLRETINTQTDAELDPAWELFVSKSLSPARGYFFRSVGTLYRVRMSYEDVDGFRTCQSDEVDLPAIDVVFTTTGTTYNPATDSYGAGTVYSKAIVLDYAKAYRRSEITDKAGESGDLCMLIPQTTYTPKAGDVFDINSTTRYGGKWRVLSTFVEHDAHNCHVRRL